MLRSIRTCLLSVRSPRYMSSGRLSLNLGLECLPEDTDNATLVGRVMLPQSELSPGGPAVVVVRNGEVFDITETSNTVSCLLNQHDALDVAKTAPGRSLGMALDILRNSAHDEHIPSIPALLAPADLQAVKACGVTFVDSMLERVIEEHAKGEPSRASASRELLTKELETLLDGNLRDIVPGSKEAQRVKGVLVAKGLWSQYLEVGLGPDAEVFTKGQPMCAVGTGAEVGLHPSSTWNNPEPEVVLAVNNTGSIVGATLGNDVNLRDIEGRSALLLGRAKDNNGSTAFGPFIRLFDEEFTIEDVRSLEIRLHVEGEDGFSMDGRSDMTRLSRDVEDLVGQTINSCHQYPDGFMLYTGTLFAPTTDRDPNNPGGGFTHRVGDVVRIANPRLGALVNRVNKSDAIPPWTMGIGALFANLAERKLL